MPYIGRPLNAGNLAVQSGAGDGSDTTPIATLDYSVGSSNSVAVYLDGVRQLAGTDFTASGTVLTFTTAPANGVGVDVYFLGLELSIPTPADDTVTGAKIVDNAIDSEHYTDGSIDTAHIANDQITLALMAPGTDGNIISYDASGNPVAIATGNDGQVLTSAGAGAPPVFEALPSAGITLGTAVASTSGATIDFTGIPTGTKRITINWFSVSTSGASHPIIQIGDSGGFETSGYLTDAAFLQNAAAVNTVRRTNGFSVGGSWSGTAIYGGSIVLSLLDASTFDWVAMGVMGRTASGGVIPSGGSKSLSAELTQVRFTTDGGSQTYDAGKINISYE